MASTHHIQRLAIGPQVRGEPAFVADAGRMSGLFQNRPERVEDLGAGPQRFGKRRRAERHDHELLQVDAAVRMRTAVQDVHHRRRQHVAAVRRRPATQSGQSVRTAAGWRAPPRRGPRPSTRRAARWRRAGSWSACRRAPCSRLSSAAWSSGWPTSAFGDLAVDVATTAERTPLPR